jgi:hypothetical protein
MNHSMKVQWILSDRFLAGCYGMFAKRSTGQTPTILPQKRKKKAFRNPLLRKALHVGATRFELATF